MAATCGQMRFRWTGPAGRLPWRAGAGCSGVAVAETGPCRGAELSPQSRLFPDLLHLFPAALCGICSPNLCKAEDHVSARLVGAAPKGTPKGDPKAPARLRCGSPCFTVLPLFVKSLFYI